MNAQIEHIGTMLIDIMSYAPLHRELSVLIQGSDVVNVFEGINQEQAREIMDMAHTADVKAIKTLGKITTGTRLSNIPAMLKAWMRSQNVRTGLEELDRKAWL